MKLLSFTGAFLLLLGAQLAFSSTTLKPALSSQQREKYLHDVNGFRGKFAEAVQISNMNELQYSESLEKFSSKFSTCETVSEVKNIAAYYIARDSAFENAFIAFATMNASTANDKDQFFGHEDSFRSILRPTINQVGCYPFEKTCTYPEKRAKEFTNAKEATYNSICFFGPITNQDVYVRIYGKPGTNCDNGAIENLCKQ